MSELKLIHESHGGWRGPKHVLFCGVRLPAYAQLHPHFEKDLPQFRTRQDDVFIASYPKSGTTWLQEIVWQVVHTGEKSTEKINNRVPFLEDSKLLDGAGTGDEKQDSRTALETLPSPRLIKSHLPYHLIPKGLTEGFGCKYIYVARNPKDVAVSFYHFLKCFGEDISGFHGPWEFYAELFLQGKDMRNGLKRIEAKTNKKATYLYFYGYFSALVCYGLWLDHVLGWWTEKDASNVLFLKYEDLKKDLAGNVKKIAGFLEKTLAEETVKRIASQCTFQGMAQNAPTYWVYDSAEGPKYMRKGKVGDWENYFTAELNTKFETELVAKLTGTGLQFEFTE